MKISKKLLGAAMSLALVGSQGMLALASSSNTDPAAGTGNGTANILDYKVETVVVPTTLKIALNPKEYDITTKYEKATAYAANTVYYKESSGTYTKADPQPTSTDFSSDTYYTAVTSDDQVVSLNYGIASKATSTKNVKVNFAVTYTADEDKKAITFVDSEAKAQAYDATNNANGAKKGEHKIYLAVASADDLPTANTFSYAKTTDTTVDANKTYYTKSGSTFTKVAGAADANIATYYEATATDTIGIGITAAELSDVIMDKATIGNQPFKKGTTNKADASIAYRLDAATYALKEGEVIDFTTRQDDLDDKLEMSVIGGIAGFTLTGAVNPDADWTEADATAITITPTYTITDATGSEMEIENDDGSVVAYNQVDLGPQASGSLSTSNKSVTITGLAEGVTLSSISLVQYSGRTGAIQSGTHYTFSNGTLTCISNGVIDNTVKEWVLTFSDNKTLTIPVVTE